jgi:hypothetical protein
VISESRVQRLIEEFEDGAALEFGGFSIGHGIAATLKHIVDTEATYADSESSYSVPACVLEEMVEALTAPTLMERALAGDKDAARQFLFEAGFTDEHGQLTGPYKSEQSND